MHITHDFHIHTNLSLCAQPDADVVGFIKAADENGITKIGFANHFWDDTLKHNYPYTVQNEAREWYAIQNFAHIAQIKADLQKVTSDRVTTYFGCEVEYDYPHHSVALTEAIAEQFDFILVPNSHTHMVMPLSFYKPHQRHIDFMIQAYYDILHSPVSRYITAMAHPFEAVCCPYDNRTLIEKISDDEFKRLFSLTAEKDIAVEINTSVYRALDKDRIEHYPTMRMFQLAKDCGCRFIFGSDAHDHACYPTHKNADIIADYLALTDDNIAVIAR